MMYTKISVYLMGATRPIVSSNSRPVEFPQVAMCLEANAYLNKQVFTKLYSTNLLYKTTAGIPRTLAIRMNLNDAFALDKRVTESMGYKWMVTFMPSLVNTFGNLISNPVRPYDMRDYLTHLMTPEMTSIWIANTTKSNVT